LPKKGRLKREPKTVTTGEKKPFLLGRRRKRGEGVEVGGEDERW